MLVKDLMSTNVITVAPETLVSEIAEILHKNHFTGVPVVNADGRVIGTISERDFITASSGLYLPTYIKLLSSMDYVQGAHKGVPHVLEQVVNATAKDIMNQDIPFARPDTTLEQLATMFAVKRVNPIPVTDANNKLLGIISRSDLIKFFNPSVISAAYKPEQRTEPSVARMIDTQVDYTQGQFTSQFAYVAKARANIWITAAIVLFIVGFVAGIIYVADPHVFTNNGPGSSANLKP
ncbi:MAG TPA: CBS domain-containing protein [Patescibacteria group bacterium]|jgi:CBS domain-containing protein|nr:CBS domain-containing protein [Patescibacteria group bacterium]